LGTFFCRGFGAPTNQWGLPPWGPSGGTRSELSVKNLQVVSLSIWIDTFGYVDIWGKLETYHDEREIYKPSLHSSAIHFGETLDIQIIYNIPSIVVTIYNRTDRHMKYLPVVP
jgi:hypothetical protein